MRLACLFLVVISLPLALKGQESEQRLPEVEIRARRPHPLSGGQSLQIDSTDLAERQGSHLGEVLASKSPVFIRNYGQGGLASPSFRGTLASHTQVFWNGLRMNSPLLGQVDFSQFPAAFNDRLSLHYGGASLHLGAGGFGGALELQTDLPQDSLHQISLRPMTGSFGTYGLSGKYQRKQGSWQQSHRLFGKWSENDFPFQNIEQAGQPQERQSNARYGSAGAVSEWAKTWGPNNRLRFGSWLQGAWRELPPTLLEAESRQFQRDLSLRLPVSYRHRHRNTLWKITGGGLFDHLYWANPATGQVSESNTWQSQLHLRAKGFFQGFSWSLGGDHYGAFARSNNFAGHKQQHQNSLMARLGKTWENLSASLLLRQGLLDAEATPFLPYLGLEGPLWQEGNSRLSWQGSASRNFHAPSLNDRFWHPVGNENLQPEKGYTFEGRLAWEQNASTWQLKQSLGGYFRRIRNQIIWLPGVSGLWRPENLRDVQSRGLESRTQFRGRLGPLQLGLTAFFSLTLSENTRETFPGDESVGRQTRYVPRRNLQGSAWLRWQGLKITAEQRAYSRRFIRRDHSAWLPDYYLTNLFLEYQHQNRWGRWTPQIRIDNLFDYHYQSIADRPMPGRRLEIGVIWSYEL